jgi:hypothetical protein
MASWKQLTDTSNLHVAVNMEQVCFMRQMPTALWHAGWLLFSVTRISICAGVGPFAQTGLDEAFGLSRSS